MASTEDRYQVRISLVVEQITEQGKKRELDDHNSTSQTYAAMGYADMVAVQQVLLNAMNTLGKLGIAKAHQLEGGAEKMALLQAVLKGD